MKLSTGRSSVRAAWNQGKLVGQKAPLKLKEIWSIRVRLQLSGDKRQLALFDLAIDSKLRACDLVGLRVRDIAHGTHIGTRGCVVQRKTKLPVQFEITPQNREALAAWIGNQKLGLEDHLFPGNQRGLPHLSTRQYARLVKARISSIDLDPVNYGTHSMRRTKASLIYQRTKNLRAVQRLLGHSKIKSTVRYLDVEMDDALLLAEQTEA
jgi:integrase